MAEKKFSIPSEQEVIEFMQKKKPGWPTAFVMHYASRFWHFYNAQGWKLSNGVAMKSWESCFHAQWQTPKYEDAQILQNMAPKNKIGFNYPGRDVVVTETVNGRVLETVQAGERLEVDFLNDVFRDYCQHPTAVPQERLTALYDSMKVRGIMKLTAEESTICREQGESKGKALAVEFVFKRAANEGRRKL